MNEMAKATLQGLTDAQLAEMSILIAAEQERRGGPRMGNESSGTGEGTGRIAAHE
jgi:hypothetical protein